jgi:hypothetical protein
LCERGILEKFCEKLDKFTENLFTLAKKSGKIYMGVTARTNERMYEP